MSKKLIKRYLPHPDKITENRWIKKLGPRLQAPDLWHINRRSLSGAAAIGIFCAFIPVPFQMLLAAIGAIIFRSNILVAVPAVWLSNPITMPPMFYFCYWIGTLILGVELGQLNFELSFEWLMSGLLEIWQPFLLGCLVVGVVSALLAFICIRLIWRYYIWTHIRKRRNRRNAGLTPNSRL
ncbi:MAG: DUF2062 domain-containing protein [Gammaproteobacteria bacterium]|nr:DUF2062 domain-containing protein [Gammaproteobacteria bacterium]